MYAGKESSSEHLLDEIERRDHEIARLNEELEGRPPLAGSDAELLVDLTSREREVLERIAEGRTTQEIADDLYLGVNSVKTHTQALFRKLGVTSRTQAALWAVRHVGSGDSRDDGAAAAAPCHVPDDAS